MRDAIDREDLLLLAHFTRNWLHYGVIGFAALCVVIGAVRGVFAPS